MVTWAQLLAETFRLRLVRGVEAEVRGCGFGRIAGVDEVGRGSLAGPVVAAAVVVDPGAGAVFGVDDSKRVGPEDRERLARVIRRAHPCHAVAVVPPADIDRSNILAATKLAMRRALRALRPAPDVALVDAVPLPGLGFPALPLTRGDAVCYAIACASILAKVERDRIMIELDRQFPYYGFAANKGYGAAEHRQALAVHGPSSAHRLTFKSVLPLAPASALQRGQL